MAKKTTYELALEIGGKLQKSLGKSVDGVNKRLDSIGKAAETAAKIATTAFAAVKVGDFMKSAASTYADFDQAMANTAATAEASAEDYQKLEAAALEMGKKTTKTATEASEALGYMALAGWDVNTSISALEPVLRLSEATSMGLATCSDLVTDSMSALGLGVDELSGYLDVACTANNKSNQSAQQLMEAYIGCGGILNNFNIKIEDSATALGVLANRGIKGSEAGNKLNAVLINLTSGTGQASKMMEKLGISAFDSEGKFIGLQKTLELVNNATKDLEDEERSAAFAAIGGKSQIDTLKDLLAGLNTTIEDGRTEWQALSDELYNAEGSMMDMAKKVTDTLPGAMSVFGSAVDDLKINLVKSFAPMAKDAIFAVADFIPHVTEKVTGFVQTLPDKAVPAIRSLKDKAIAVFKRVQPALEDIGSKGAAAFGFMAETGQTAFRNVKAVIEENQPVIDRVAAAALDLKDKLFEAFEKAKPVISYIATQALPQVTTAAMELIGAAATVYQKVQPILEDIGSKGAAVFEFMAETGQTAFQNVKTAIEENQPAIEQVIMVASDLKDKLFEAFEKAEPVISYIATQALPQMSAAAMKLIRAAVKVYQKLNEWGLIKPIIMGIAGAIAAVRMVKFANNTLNSVKAVKALVTVLLAQKKAMLANLALKVKDKAETLYIYSLYAREAIAKGASTAATWAQTAAQTAWNAVCAVGTAVTTALGAAFAFLTSPIGIAVAALAGIIAIGVILYKNWDIIKEHISNAVQAFADKFPVAFAFISSIFESWYRTADNVVSGVKQVLQGIIQFFTGAFTGDWQKALDGLKNIFSGAFRVLSSLAMAPLNALKGVVTGVFNAINAATGGKLDEMKTKFTEKLSSVKQTASEAFSNVAGTVWDMMSQAASNARSHLESMEAAYTSAGGGIEGIMAVSMQGIQGIVSDVMSAVNTITGGKLEELQNAFQSKMEAAKSVVSDGLNAIKEFFSGLMLKLPDIKLPHFSINGSFSLSPPSIPKLGVEWYRKGGILTRPTIFGADSGSLLGGGEAGHEAVLPLSELWTNMRSVVAGVVGSTVPQQTAAESGAGIFDQIRQLVSGGQAAEAGSSSITKELYNTVNHNSTINRTSEENSSDNSSKIVFSPQIIIQGSADREDVESALHMSQAEFERMYAEHKRQKGRTVFAT